MLKVAVIGARGRMGSASCAAIEQSSRFELVAKIGEPGKLDAAHLRGAQVALEFTNPSSTKANTLRLLDLGLDVVVGSSGWNETDLEEVAIKCRETGRSCLVAPNFALSAVLVMEFARLAAPFFASAEVVEMHHPRKLDAPSGTADATAKRMVQERKNAAVPPAPDATESDELGCRGGAYADVRVHSLRVLGATAHQEVVLGNEGELLTLRTDCMGTESFMPGVLLALGEVSRYPGLTVGLEKVMRLGA